MGGDVLNCVRLINLEEMKSNGYYMQRTYGRTLSDILHSHTFYELLYVVDGSCVHECNGQNEVLTPNTFVFIIPDISHRFISQTDNCDIIAVSVACTEMEKFMFIFNGNSNFTTLFKLKQFFHQSRVS